MKNKFYVYGLFEPLDNNELDNCFYIGKGCGSRLDSHFWDCFLDESNNIVNNPHKVRKIKKLKRNNKKPYSKKIFTNLSEGEALRKEKVLIEEIGLNNLVNINEGGKKGAGSGRDNHFYGVTGEDHPAYGIIRKGEENPMYGKRHSESTREKMSKKKRGKNHPFYGKERSREFKEKVGKLSRREIGEIKWLAQNSNKTQKQISSNYNICRVTVSDIKREKIWKSVEPLEPTNKHLQEKSN